VARSTSSTAQTEADKFGGFVRRIVRAYGRRVADRDIEALAGLAELQTELDTVVRASVEALLAQGYSWADIGRQLGISRQGAQQRYGKR
jgi:hypothetical protein